MWQGHNRCSGCAFVEPIIHQCVVKHPQNWSRLSTKLPKVLDGQRSGKLLMNARECFLTKDAGPGQIWQTSRGGGEFSWKAFAPLPRCLREIDQGDSTPWDSQKGYHQYAMKYICSIHRRKWMVRKKSRGRNKLHTAQSLWRREVVCTSLSLRTSHSPATALLAWMAGQNQSGGRVGWVGWVGRVKFYCRHARGGRVCGPLAWKQQQFGRHRALHDSRIPDVIPARDESHKTRAEMKYWGSRSAVLSPQTSSWRPLMKAWRNRGTRKKKKREKIFTLVGERFTPTLR